MSVSSPPSNVWISSKQGLVLGTKVFAGDQEITGVTKIVVDPLAASEDGLVTVTITLEGVAL